MSSDSTPFFLRMETSHSGREKRFMGRSTSSGLALGSSERYLM